MQVIGSNATSEAEAESTDDASNADDEDEDEQGAESPHRPQRRTQHGASIEQDDGPRLALVKGRHRLRKAT